MKALVKETPEPGISYVDLPDPQIEHPDDVLIRVAYCAIDLDDTWIYVWNERAADDESLHLPAVLGHNVSGIVAKVGSAVTHVKPGDRVAVEPIITCRRCHQCRDGRPNLCTRQEFFGKRRGGFADYAVVPERSLHLLPEAIGLKEGALVSSFGAAVHAVEMAAPDPGGWAVVIGATPAGLMATLALKAWGVNTVISDVVEGRLEVARDLMGVPTLNARVDEPRRFLADLTDGRRTDCVVQTMATQVAFDEALSVVRDGGTIVTIAGYWRAIEVNLFTQITRREIRLVGAIGRTDETWQRVEELIRSGRVDLKPMVTGVFTMDQYDTAFELMRTGAALNILLQPQPEVDR